MALSLPQQLWLKKAYVGDIVEKLQLGAFSIEELREYADAYPAFSEKLALIEATVNNIEDPAESRRYAAVSKAAGRYLTIGEGSGKTVLENLEAFISDYAGASYAADDVARCKALRKEVAESAARIAEEQWAALFDADGILKSPEALSAFLEDTAAESGYAERADDALWQWAVTRDDVVKGVERYEETHRGQGLHSTEAAEVYNAQSEWNRIDGTSIYDLLEFTEFYPDHIFNRKAMRRLKELKATELAALRRAPALFDNQTFCALYRKGICTKKELCEACGADDAMFERIISDSKIRSVLPPPPGSNSSYAGGAGEPGLLDVVLFGVAASGKTSVLSGLLSHDSVTADEVNYSGEYASVLRRYAGAGIAVSGTPDDFVAVVKATAIGADGRNRSFNLVEMAGEAFTKKIVDATGRNGRKVSDFGAMESKVSAILTNTNDKLIFLLIDPTCDRMGRQEQIAAFNRLRSLMFDVAGNSAVMQRVRGIHFIVTKADTLGANRREKAEAIVREILNSASRKALTENCRSLGINYSADSARNGLPRVFCFSLGRFNVGNIYTYDPKDSGELLSVIGSYTERREEPGIMEFFRKFFIQPFQS